MAKTTVNGVATRASSGQVLMYFVVEGSELCFTANISPGVLPFTSATAVLSYSDRNSLTGTKTITSSVIGTSTFSFNFNDGNSVSGTINQALSIASQCTGSGSWSSFD